MQNLHVITLWDDKRPNSYAIVAMDMEEAKKEGIKRCKEERTEDQLNDPEPYVDDELCFELTCAGDKSGNLYNILLLHQSNRSEYK